MPLLRCLSAVSWKVKICKFQPQKLPLDISENNETEVMHWITIRASSTLNIWNATSVAMTTLTDQNGQKTYT